METLARVIDPGRAPDATTSIVGHTRWAVLVRRVMVVGCGRACVAGPVTAVLLVDDRLRRPDDVVSSVGLRCQILLEFLGSNVQTIGQFTDRQIFLDM